MINTNDFNDHFVLTSGVWDVLANLKLAWTVVFCDRAIKKKTKNAMVAHGIDPGTPVPGDFALTHSATSSTKIVDLLEIILRLPWDRGTVSDVASATYWKMSHYFWFCSKDVAILGHIPTPVHQ